MPKKKRYETTKAGMAMDVKPAKRVSKYSMIASFHANDVDEEEDNDADDVMSEISPSVTFVSFKE